MPFRILNQYYPVRNVLFVIGEGAVIYASVLLADWLLLGSRSFIIDRWLAMRILLITFVCQICLYYNDLYDLNISYRGSELSVRLLQSLGVATIFLAGIYLVFPKAIIGRGLFFAVTLGFLILFIVFWRFFCTLILNRRLFNRKIMILGSGELAQLIADEIARRKNCGYVVTGVALESQNDADLYSAGRNFVQESEKLAVFYKDNHEGLCEEAKDLGVRRVVVALRNKRSGFPTKELIECRISGIDVMEGDRFYEMLTGKLNVEHIDPEWLIFSEGFKKSLFTLVMKRALDVVLSAVMLITFLPVIIITAILIRLDSRGPIFFSQERVGEKRERYNIHKFRSMIADAEKETGPKWAGQDDPRITRVGNFIRRWRVDEIPQLWNVLKGEMSFVGPRPEREFFVKGLEYIIPYYGARFTAKPGITGWAQVSYGYGASVKDAIEKLNYDLFYMKNMSIAMDIVIILRTVKTVISGIGR